MDLSESRGMACVRHPWEVARVRALVRILSRCAVKTENVLDIGCGDGYAGRIIATAMGGCKYVGVDTEFTDASLAAAQASFPEGRFLRTRDHLLGSRMGLLLLLDVVEHVDEDAAFLRAVVDEHVLPSGHVLITVPAFQSLFGAHDIRLRHCRRYSFPRLSALTRNVGLEVVDGGYLFASLLVARTLTLAYQRIGCQSKVGGDGVGNWRQGARASAMIAFILEIESRLMLWAGGLNMKVPGLSVWLLCKKPPL